MSRRRVRALLGLLLAGAVLTGGVLYRHARLGGTAARAEREAREAVRAGRFAEARGPLARWLAARPGAAEAHALKAEVALAGGDLGEVSDELRAAQGLGCPADRIDRVDALVKTRLGRLAEALPVLVRLRNASDLPDPAVDEALARIFLQQYRMTLAEAALNRWIQDAPSDARPHLWLTEIDHRFDREALLEPHYRAALERDPTLNRARLGLAGVLRSRHLLEEAGAEYAAAVARAPDDPEALTGLGGVARERDDLDTAARHLDHALRVAPDDPRALKERALLDLRLNEPAAAASRLDRAVAADPADAELLYARSLALKRLGQADRARADVEALERLRKEQAAVVALRQRVLAAPADPEPRYEIALWMFRHGRGDECVGWAQSALDLRPRHTAANALLAEHYTKTGEPGRANYYRLIADSGS